MERTEVTPTSDLGFHYHHPSSEEGQRYDASHRDPSTEIHQRVNLSHLHTIQFSANNERMQKYSSGKHSPPSVTKIGMEHWVEDGIHRIASAKKRGETHMMMNVALGRKSG